MDWKNTDFNTTCLQNGENALNLPVAMIYGNKAFDPEVFLRLMKVKCPKIVELMNKIKELDEQDMKKNKQTYKHFIYTNRASKYGVNLLASAFIAHGYKPFKSKSKLEKDSFGVISDKKLGGKPIPKKTIKDTFEAYNTRPFDGNLRFIILDTGFREGVDLYDVKYMHMFEKIVSNADEKQAVARATRFCGQKGLKFDSKKGWPLHVFEYDFLLEGFSLPDFTKERMKDTALEQLNDELSLIVAETAVDHDLNKNIHEFKGGFPERFRYPKPKMQNLCKNAEKEVKNGPVKFTKTQEFVSYYFVPKSEHKGLLLWSSMGSGKTCTAMAAISSSFEKEGYTIIWVTKHTLKSDIYKNMFKQVCHMGFRDHKPAEL